MGLSLWDPMLSPGRRYRLNWQDTLQNCSTCGKLSEVKCGSGGRAEQKFFFYKGGRLALKTDGF